MSRRFVAKTEAQLEAWQSQPLDGLDLVGLILDGVHVGEHCLIVALGIAADGRKHALGACEGSTENAAVCQSLLSNRQSRGLRTDRNALVILDGSKALRKAVRDTFGEAALVQRCQIHKLRNVLDHLPERQRPWVKAILQRAYHSGDVAVAGRLLQTMTIGNISGVSRVTEDLFSDPGNPPGTPRPDAPSTQRVRKAFLATDLTGAHASRGLDSSSFVLICVARLPKANRLEQATFYG